MDEKVSCIIQPVLLRGTLNPSDPLSKDSRAPRFFSMRLSPVCAQGTGERRSAPEKVYEGAKEEKGGVDET